MYRGGIEEERLTSCVQNESGDEGIGRGLDRLLLDRFRPVCRGRPGQSESHRERYEPRDRAGECSRGNVHYGWILDDFGRDSTDKTIQGIFQIVLESSRDEI